MTSTIIVGALLAIIICGRKLRPDRLGDRP